MEIDACLLDRVQKQAGCEVRKAGVFAALAFRVRREAPSTAPSLGAGQHLVRQRCCRVVARSPSPWSRVDRQYVIIVIVVIVVIVVIRLTLIKATVTELPEEVPTTWLLAAVTLSCMNPRRARAR